MNIRVSFFVCFVSILCDGSSDAGIIEQEVIYAHYLQDGIPVKKFVGMKPPAKADAKGITNAIDSELKTFSEHSNDENYLHQIIKK